MKGYNKDYGDYRYNNKPKRPQNGIDYNTAGSNSVRDVDIVLDVNDLHDIPKYGLPNSVTKNNRNNVLTSERYFDDNGHAYLDIDYTDHGNPKTHPHVPHEHDIWFDENGSFHRGKDKGIL